MQFYYKPEFARGFTATINCFRAVLKNPKKLEPFATRHLESELHSRRAALLKRLEDPARLLCGLEPGYNLHLLADLESVERMLKMVRGSEMPAEFRFKVVRADSEEEIIGGIYGCIVLLYAVERSRTRSARILGSFVESLGACLVRALKDFSPVRFLS